MNTWINFLYTRWRKIGPPISPHNLTCSLNNNFHLPWSNLLQSQQDLSTYRGLVPFNFQHLENNLKPFELLMEPSSEETSLSIIMIIKCDQNKWKSQAHPPSLIWFEYYSEKGLARVNARCATFGRPSCGSRASFARPSRAMAFLSKGKVPGEK